MKKKLMAAALSGAMALSLAVPAFAASETVVTATYAEPVIEVSVPTTATAVINPYGLPCKFTYDPATGKTVKAGTEGAVDFALDAAAKTAIATQPMILVNYGETALDVYATPTVTIKAGSDLAVSSEAKLDQDADKDGNKPPKAVSIQVAGAPLKNVAASWDADTKKLKMDAGLAAAWGKVDWTDSGVAKTDPFAVENKNAGTAVSGEEKKLGELAAISKDEGAKDTDPAKVQDDCMLAVTVLSDAVKKPKTDWTVKDIVTLKIAYTFEVNAGT